MSACLSSLKSSCVASAVLRTHAKVQRLHFYLNCPVNMSTLDLGRPRADCGRGANAALLKPPQAGPPNPALDARPSGSSRRGASSRHSKSASSAACTQVIIVNT